MHTRDGAIGKKARVLWLAATVFSLPSLSYGGFNVTASPAGGEIDPDTPITVSGNRSSLGAEQNSWYRWKDVTTGQVSQWCYILQPGDSDPSCGSPPSGCQTIPSGTGPSFTTSLNASGFSLNPTHEYQLNGCLDANGDGDEGINLANLNYRFTVPIPPVCSWTCVETTSACTIPTPGQPGSATYTKTCTKEPGDCAGGVSDPSASYPIQCAGPLDALGAACDPYCAFTLDTAAPVIVPSIFPAEPNGSSGWYRSHPAVSAEFPDYSAGGDRETQKIYGSGYDKHP